MTSAKFALIRKTAAALLLVLTGCASDISCRSGPGAPPDDAAEFVGISQAWISRYNAGDASGVAALYAPDAYYASAHVLAHGRDEIRSYWSRGIAAGGHVDFIRPVEVRVSGELGYLLGRYQATNAGMTVDGRILIVGRRLDGRWHIAAHETVVRDQPE